MDTLSQTTHPSVDSRCVSKPRRAHLIRDRLDVLSKDLAHQRPTRARQRTGRPTDKPRRATPCLRLARDVRVGEIIPTATGPVMVLKREPAHNGIESLVRTWWPGTEDGAERLLWHWPQEGLRIAAADSAEARAWAAASGARKAAQP